MLFELPWEINTTDLVLEEFADANQRKRIDEYAQNEVLRVKRYPPNEVENLAVFKLRLPYTSNLSLADCSVWMLAQELKCPLLTGDGKLRRMAKDNIEVHGVLYVFEQFVTHRLLDRNIQRIDT